jgi:hypothetical protein
MNFIKTLPHDVKKPVSIEREAGDVIVIEGVRYAGDYFRMFGAPDPDVLYAVQRLEKGCVEMTIITCVEEAIDFFEENRRHA